VKEVCGWRVSLESSPLDHRHILYSVLGEQEEKVNYKLSLLFGRNVARACVVSSSLCHCDDNEIAVGFLQQAIAFLYESTCPLWTTGSKRKLPWWSPQLGRLHRETRRLLNKDRRTGMPSDWKSFMEAQRI
jgi:hypothetical protein